MIDERILLGFPIPFEKLLLYPPKVREVIGLENFGQMTKALTISQEELEDAIVEAEVSGKKISKNIPTPLEYLLGSCYNSPEFLEIVKSAFQLYTHQDIYINYDEKQIIIGNIAEVNSLEDFTKLTEDNYFDFQNEIRCVLGMPKIDPPNPDENPRIKQMKAKARYRDRIKAQKGNGISTSTCLLAICCMGNGINLLNIGEMSYAAMNPLIEMYQQKEKYQLDIDSLLAGADSKKIKPKYWINNLTN